MTVTDPHVNTKITVQLNYHCPHATAMVSFPDINECDSEPCQNGGTCEDHLAGFVCICAPGYANTSCSGEI